MILTYHNDQDNVYIDRTTQCQIYTKAEALEIASNQLYGLARLVPPGHRDLPKAIKGFYPKFHINVKMTSTSKEKLEELQTEGWQVAPIISVTHGQFAVLEEMEFIAVYRDGTVIGLDETMLNHRYIQKDYDHVMVVNIEGVKASIIFKDKDNAEKTKQSILNNYKLWH